MLKKVLLINTVIFILFYGGCGNDDDANTIDPKTAQLNALAGLWQVNGVINDNIDVSDQFTSFTLQITENRYTTQNGGNPWSEQGTFDIKSDDINILTRDDDVELKIDELNEGTLVLSFNYSVPPGGRRSGITGQFTFSLVR
ncbi:MAG: lipocalin family protein [Bacteroidota bacterium]